MQTTSLALDRLLCAIGDPLAVLRDIGPGHPEFERAQVIRAGTAVLAKSPDALPAIAQVIGSTAATAPQVRAHLAAAEAWLRGDPVLAAERYASVLDRWPRDLLALRLAQSSYFFLGWHDPLTALIDAVRPAWKRGQPGFEHMLAIASFAYAENGDAERAESLGRQSLASNSGCPLGVHAVAHAIAESGRPRDGAQWMRDQRTHWAGESRMRTHNAWHLAMFDVEEGEAAAALGILDGWLLPASERSALDACDATALLWQIAAGGIDDTGRWRRLSDTFERTLTPGFWPYVDLHAALAHLVAGEQARTQRLTQAIEACARGEDYAALRARRVTLPALQALAAWFAGRYGEAAGTLKDLARILGEAGGSRVQLELFESIGREAERRQRARKRVRPLPPAPMDAGAAPARKAA